jgi:hypothetical protein
MAERPQHHVLPDEFGVWFEKRGFTGAMALREAEEEVGRMLTRSEVLNMAAQRMKRYDIPMNFTAWRGR